MDWSRIRIERVPCPTDFSDHSAHALTRAADFPATVEVTRRRHEQTNERGGGT